jgi:hypothetical protein
MSTISASTTSTTAYKVTGDTTGNLVIQTGSGPTTALTLDTAQNATFAGYANLPNTFGFKNRIINGAFGIWQRGTSSSTSGAYLADRFFISGSSSITASQSTDTPSGFKYSISLSGTGYPQAVQRIESLNCSDLVGQSVTVSFWAKQTSGAGAGSLAVILYYPTAQDNYASQTAVASAVTFTGTGSWAQYTATFTSLPSGVANGISCTLYANTAGAATWLLTGVQLEKSSTATSFDYRPYGTELALCQRYYQKWVSTNGSYLSIGSGVVVNSSTTINRWGFPLGVVMRASPNINLVNCVGWDGTVGGAASVAVNYSSTNNIDVDVTTSSMTPLLGHMAKVLINGATGGYIETTGTEL